MLVKYAIFAVCYMGRTQLGMLPPVSMQLSGEWASASHARCPIPCDSAYRTKTVWSVRRSMYGPPMDGGADKEAMIGSVSIG